MLNTRALVAWKTVVSHVTGIKDQVGVGSAKFEDHLLEVFARKGTDLRTRGLAARSARLLGLHPVVDKSFDLIVAGEDVDVDPFWGARVTEQFPMSSAVCGHCAECFTRTVLPTA